MKRIWIKLALAFMAVGASGILISTFLSIKEMDYHFNLYIRDVNEQHQRELLSLIHEGYQQENKWNEQAFLKLDTASKVLGLRVSLYDDQHRIIRVFGSKGSDAASVTSMDDRIPIVQKGKLIGYLQIEHNNSSAITLEEHFQMAHTNALQWTMVVLIVLVCVVSVLTARRIARPIVEMSAAALAAAKGNLSVRVTEPSGNDELSGLVRTFNHLIQNLQQQEELRKRLTSDIAHELRTPLNTLLAQTEGMIDGVWKPTTEHMEATRSEVLRLIRIVSDLDQVIQAEAGSMNMAHEVVNVSKVVESIVDSMRPICQQKQITLSSTIVSDAWVVGDEHRLGQVFANLLTNSFKHTAAGGKVDVMVETQGSLIIAKVVDDGSGIAAEDLPHVFERFYRGDRSRHRETGGSGLGLTIVKGIVEAHDGEIDICSVEGQGTTVTIQLPSR
ncbi:sensor histidine kinase [Brevibacillus migulae]|uniref:sensor histidine kinase n=1 Tax=Brevibacillus migulae TaxID=1644114 RepID=UPI00106E2CB8|nr:ATP-binding protein [Brevibacillus migulae]